MTRPSPLRVAHVNFSLGTGGLETGLINLIRHLPSDEFEHGIFTMKGLGPNADRARALGAHVEQVGSMEGRNRTIIWKLMRRLRWFRPHIVHTRNFGAMDAIIAARLARVPRVVHGEHGYDKADPDGTNKKRRRIRRWLAPGVSRFVTVSDELNAWLSAHGGSIEKKVTTIHNGVDLDRFRWVSEKPVPTGPPLVIGTVARLVPIKDQASMIKAFSILAGRHPDLKLRLVGDGPLRTELQDLARSTGHGDRVEFAGERNDVDVQFDGLSVFLLSSLNEGISNTVLEAMASGRPVIATRVGGNPELVVEGETGVLVDRQSSEDLARAIEVYLKNPDLLEAHGAAGRRRAIEHFSIPRMVEDYRQLYRSVLG